MNLLDRYIFRNVLFACAVAVGMLAFVFILVSALRDLLGYILAGQIAWPMVVKLLLLLLPAIMPFVLAPGMLTGVLLTLGRLSADSEITAMRAAGVSLPRIARPIFLLAALGVAAGLFVNFEAMPYGRVQYERQLREAVRTQTLSFIVPRTFIRLFPGKVIYVGERDGAAVKDCWVWMLDDQQRVVRFVHGDSGRVDYDGERNALELTLLNFKGEWREPKNPEDFSKNIIAAAAANSGRQEFPLDKIIGRQSFHQKLQWMTYDQLRAEHARLAARPVPPGGAKQHARDVMKVLMVISDKANTALAVLSFALIGVPLGIKISRRETSANLGVALLLMLAYYFLTVTLGWIDRHPEYHPNLLLWLPNLLFISLGVWLFRRLDRPVAG